MNEAHETNPVNGGEGRGGAEVGPGLRPASEASPGWRSPAQAAPASEHHAAHLRETSGSAYLYCTMSRVFREVGPEAYKTYLLKVLEDAGKPTDPIEQMLVEQIVLAHHSIGRLHVKAATTDDLEAARVYLGSAALLTGEFRRSISTLKSYREPSRVPAGRVDVAGPDADVEQNAVDGELASNMGGDDDEGTIPLPESQEGRGGSKKPGQAARPKRRRA